MHAQRCVCASIPALDTQTKLALVVHHRELSKTTGTGPLATLALKNSALYVHGKREAPLDLSHLHREDRRVFVLFPAEDARVLSPALAREDPRPITLVVPDGNWRQATRIPKRVPGLVDAPRVVLPPGAASAWGVRRETRADGMATFEAIAQAFGLLESPAIQSALEALFRRATDATLATRAPAATQDVQLSLLYRDEHLVVVDKPAGMLVHKGWARDGVVALQALREQLARFVYPVHRLDRATSGALVFAFSSEVARDLQANLASARAHKRYLAVCRGHDALGTIDHPLKNERGDERAAVTDVQRLAVAGRYGLYEARPRTGRTHQIRRHLKHAAHPIIGDVRYGKGDHNRAFRERYNFHRMALHCERLAFDHPRTDGRVDVRAPLPAEMVALFTALGWQA